MSTSGREGRKPSRAEEGVRLRELAERDFVRAKVAAGLASAKLHAHSAAEVRVFFRAKARVG